MMRLACLGFALALGLGSWVAIAQVPADGTEATRSSGPPLFYSNSGNLADPYMTTRTGQCVTNGAATDVQTSLGLQQYGFGCQASPTYNNAVADDIVLSHGYVVERIGFYLYQKNASSASISSIGYAFSDTDLNGQLQPTWTTVVPSVSLANVYRKLDFNTANQGCDRRMQQAIVALSSPVTLSAGTHWLAWRGTGTVSDSPYQAPVVIPGEVQKPGANGLQAVLGQSFAPALDAGNSSAQDFSFELYGYELGDMNCDGTVDFADINPFVLYLSDLPAWQAAFPDCPVMVGDINADGTYGQASFGDINPFVARLSGGG
jgi:hypothetical protein